MKHKLSTKCVILISVISSVVVLAILFAIVYKIDQYKKEEPLLSKEEYIGSTWHLDGFDLDFYVYNKKEASTVLKSSMGYPAIPISNMKINNKKRHVELHGITPGSHTFEISARPITSEWADYWEGDIDLETGVYTFASGAFAKKSNDLFILTVNSVAEDFPESEKWEQLIGKKLELRRVE